MDNVSQRGVEVGCGSGAKTRLTCYRRHPDGQGEPGAICKSARGLAESTSLAAAHGQQSLENVEVRSFSREFDS